MRRWFLRAPDLSKSRGLFVYGTLQSNEVLAALLGCDLPKTLTIVEDIAIFKTQGRVYPFAMQRPGKHATGALIEPEKLEFWTILDYFEDPRYSLSLVETHNGKAWCYLDSDQAFTPDGPWDYGEFRQKHLDDYVAGCKRIRDRFLREHPAPPLR